MCSAHRIQMLESPYDHTIPYNPLAASLPGSLCDDATQDTLTTLCTTLRYLLRLATCPTPPAAHPIAHTPSTAPHPHAAH